MYIQYISGKPFITNAETIMAVAVGADININVSFYSNDKTEPRVKWYSLINESRIAIRNILGDMFNIDTFEDEVHVLYHNKMVIQQGFTTQLALRDIKSTDLTKYEVEIINSIGVAFHSVTLVP